MASSKQDQYALKLLSQIGEVFQEDCDNYISVEEMQDEDNATDFIHALANIIPTHFFNKLTGNESNMLEFNHMANALVFQNSQLKD